LVVQLAVKLLVNNMRSFLSTIYAAAVKRRNDGFNRGRTPVRHAPVPVISIGNLSSGGTGKTPFTQTMVSFVQEHFPDARPAIVSRGYGRSSRGGVVVANASGILTRDPNEAGDEPLLHAMALPTIPVVVHEKRVEGAKIAVRECGANLIVLDDGFQHRQLYRDMDIVLLDNVTLDAPFLLPRGRLREDVQALRRADVICFMNGAATHPFAATVHENLKPDAVVIEAETNSGMLHRYRASEAVSPNASICAVSGIAHPKRFHESLQKQGWNVRQTLVFHDHVRYSARHVRQILGALRRTGTNIIATTEKDAVKLQIFSAMFVARGVTVAVLPLSCSVTANTSGLLALCNARFGSRLTTTIPTIFSTT
jgi:tetraacyldisaccharide 4'-kinase